MDGLYEDLGFKEKDAYSFFEKNNIDVSKCSNFDFSRKQLKKQVIQDNTSKVTKYNKLGSSELSHQVHVGNLKMEVDGSYTTPGYFLFEKNVQSAKLSF